MFRSGDWLHNDVTYPHEKKGDGGVRKMILILNYCVCPDNPPELSLATPQACTHADFGNCVLSMAGHQRMEVFSCHHASSSREDSFLLEEAHSSSIWNLLLLMTVSLQL